MMFNWLRKIALICFGLLLTVVVLELGLRGAGAVLFYIQHKGNVRVAEDGTYRILCIGESTTARGGDDSWPAQLEQVLNLKSDKLKFRVFNKGNEAVDTNFILSNLPDWLEHYQPDMLVSMMGINDEGELEEYSQTPAQPALKQPSFFSRFRLYSLYCVLSDRVGALLEKRAFFRKGRKKPEFADSDNPEAIYKTANQVEILLGQSNKSDISVRAKVQHVSEKNPNNAKELVLLEKAVLQNPDDFNAHFRFAVSLREQGKLDDAEKIIAKAEKITGAETEDRLFIEKANLAMARGRLAEAEQFYRTAISINPHYDGTYLDLGLCLLNQEKRETEAVKMFQECLNHNPDNYEALLALVGIFYNKQEFKAFEDVAIKGLELNPGAVEITRWLVEYYKNDNRIDEAEELLESACINNPDDVFCYIAWAAFLRERGDGGAGLSVCLRAEEKFRDVPELLLEKAFCLFGIEYTDEALDCFKQALSCAGDKKSQLVFEISQFLFDAGRFEAAESFARAGLEAGQDSAEFYFLLAKISEALNRAGEFEMFLNKAVQNNANGFELQMAIVRMQLSKENYSEAEKIFLECLEMFPDFRMHIISSLAELYSLEQVYSFSTHQKMVDLFLRFHKLRKKSPELFLRYSGESGIVKLCAFGAQYLRELGQTELAEEYYVFACRQRMRTYCRTTKENYRKLKTMLSQRGITLVCMQYPLRSADDLRKLFNTSEDMFFVENKDNFFNALSNHKYEELFTDHFGGDFGHATRKGNLVIAQNLAPKILEIIEEQK